MVVKVGRENNGGRDVHKDTVVAKVCKELSSGRSVWGVQWWKRCIKRYSVGKGVWGSTVMVEVCKGAQWCRGVHTLYS